MSKNSLIPNRLDVLEKCVAYRKELSDRGLFSVSPEVGYTIIFTSGETKEDIAVLKEHAHTLCDDTDRGFYDSEIICQPNSEKIIEAVKNPEVTGISFIGDGSFGTYNLPNRSNSQMERVTWDRLAKATTHLKTGIVEQRTCTVIRDPQKETRVALPAFIVADQTQIISSVDESFANHCGFSEFNLVIRQIYSLRDNTAEQLRRPIGFDF